MTNIAANRSITEAVTTLLSDSAIPATLTIEHCASTLAMSMTSFRRKLSQEETTFKLIQHKYLNQLCVQALLTKQVNIDALAETLGYSERATFERAFRQKFGTSPAKFRELSLLGNNENSLQSLRYISQNMAPLPVSCQQLLDEKEQGNLVIQRVIDIITQDPIFSGRVMGLASMAIYGKTPKDIKEAVSRNLGINTVINIAVIYAVKDALENKVQPDVIERCTHAFLVAPKFFQLLRRSVTLKYDVARTEQVLTFALLGILLLCHKDGSTHELMQHSLQGISDLQSLNKHINESIGVSIYKASALMLSLWHIDATVLKELLLIDKISQKSIDGSKEDEMVLFMLSCLYMTAAGHEDYNDLAQKAELLGVENFTEIKALLALS